MKSEGAPTSGIVGHFGAGVCAWVVFWVSASGVFGVSAFLGMDTFAGVTVGLCEPQLHSNKDTAKTAVICGREVERLGVFVFISRFSSF